MLRGQGGQVDVAVGNRKGTAGLRGDWTLGTESGVLKARPGSVSSERASPPALSGLNRSSLGDPRDGPTGTGGHPLGTCCFFSSALPSHSLLIAPTLCHLLGALHSLQPQSCTLYFSNSYQYYKARDLPLQFKTF